MGVEQLGGNTMLGKANAVPYEDQAGMSEVQRKRLLMQQLLKESLSGGSGVVPDSGALKVPDYAGAIGKVLQAYIGTKGAEYGAKEAEALTQKAQQTHASEMAKFYDTAQSKPFGGYKFDGQEMAGPPKDSSEYTGMSKANMVEAIKNASMSIDPRVAAFGQEQEKLRQKARLDAINTGHFMPESAGPNVDPSEYQLKPSINVVNGVINQTTPGKATPPVPQVAGATFAKPGIDEGTGLPGQFNEQTNEFIAKSGGNVGQPVNAAAIEITKDSVKDLVKRISASYDKINPQIANLGSIVDSLDVLDKAYVGAPWSSLELPVQKALLKLGLKPDPDGKIPATESVVPLLGQEAFRILQALRPASDRDVLFAKEMLAIASPSDVETTKNVVKLASAAMLNDYQSHGRSMEALREYGKNEAFAPFMSAWEKQYGLQPIKLGPSKVLEDLTQHPEQGITTVNLNTTRPQPPGKKPPLSKNATPSEIVQYYSTP